MPRELPVDAKVVCKDGDVGWVTDLVVDPAARAVTHIVVRQNDVAAREFLVPLSKVTDSSRSSVQLDCTRAELATFPEFTTTHYVPASSPEAQPVVAAWEMDMMSNSFGYEPIYLPTISPDEQVPIVEDQLPAGEIAFQRGALVQSSNDQNVGEVAAMIVNPEDGTIAHFVVLLTSGMELTLPLSTVDHTAAGFAYLKLTQAQVEQLPAVPAGGRFNSAGGKLQLISFVFDQSDKADEAMRLAHKTDNKLDAAVVRKDASGKITSHEPGDLSTRKGAVAGAVVGGVLTVVGGPLGLVAAAAVGGAAGGLVGKKVDRGVPDRYLRDLGRALRSGSSALVVLVPQETEAALTESLAPLEGRVLRLELTDEMINRLTEAS
jgi:uncharacterized membrane protein